MAHNAIYRLIIDAKGGSVSTDDGSSQAAKRATKKEDGTDVLKRFGKKVAGFYASTSLVRNAVKTEVGLMDVYTGNDYQQRVIEGAISIAESAISLGITFAISRVAGVAMLAGKAISLGAEARRKGVELYTQSLEAGLVRERAGGAFNRSRIAGRY